MFPTEISDIDHAKYVCSIGLMKACDDIKLIHYIDPFRTVFDWQKILSYKGDRPPCIYVKMGNFIDFVHQIFDNIPYSFILITSDGDETFPNDCIDIGTFKNMINNDKIIRWYSSNCDISIHPKLTIIPFGFSYHCAAIWENIPISVQEAKLDNIRCKSKPFFERECKCYSNFHFVSYNEFGNARERAIEEISKDVVFYEPYRLPQEETYKNQTKYTFVISPHGHGLDCVRTWEALVLGCIVVVKKSCLDPLYENLPVLIVNEWGDITQELLENTMNEFKHKVFDYEKLLLQYWVKKIHAGSS